MTSISLDSVRNNVDELVEKVRAGESFTITDADQPVAVIQPAQPVSVGKRPFGLAAGEFCVPDDFNAELPEEILRSFEGV